MKETETGWRSRYSSTDEPDDMGRWARIPYYKGLRIGWVNREQRGTDIKFIAYTNFPINGNDSATGLKICASFEEAKEYVEDEWKQFLKKIK